MCVCLFKMPVFLLLFYIYLVSSLDIGEKCQLKNGSAGQCVPIYKCLPAIKEWQKGVLPDLCNLNGKEPIPTACCPKNDKTNKITKSEQMCSEYANLKSRHRRHIAGGSPAMPHEFTHMAALGYDDEDDDTEVWLCGGTLISDLYVLTAAHCLNSRQYGEVKYIRIGDVLLDSNEDHVIPQDFTISNKLPHPGYKTSSRYNDIALLKLSRKAIFNQHVYPACLYTNFEIHTNRVTAIGWGLSDVLRKVDVDLYPDQICTRAYKMYADKTLRLGILSESQLCAGGMTEIGDTCKGDSGGPLLAPTEHHAKLNYVIGVTSFGKPCGNLNSPGVYTRVSHYITWIESIVWP